MIKSAMVGLAVLGMVALAPFNSANADTYDVYERIVSCDTVPPALVVEYVGVSADPNLFWVPGHWIWTGNAYYWRRGYYSRVHAGWAWEPARWRFEARRWHYVPGRWHRR